MMDIFTGQPLWNHICDWFELSEFYIEPTEDAADGPECSVEVHMDNEDKESFDLAHYCLSQQREGTRRKHNSRQSNAKLHVREAQTHTGDIGSFFH